MRFARSGCAKIGQHALHCGARSDFTLLLTAYSVGQGKQPSMSASMSWRGGDDVTYIVLIVLAHYSSIGELGELQVKHRTTRGNAEVQHSPISRVQVLVSSQI